MATSLVVAVDWKPDLDGLSALCCTVSRRVLTLSLFQSTSVILTVLVGLELFIQLKIAANNALQKILTKTLINHFLVICSSLDCNILSSNIILI